MTYDTLNDKPTMQPGGKGTLLAGRYRVVRQLGQGGMGSVWLVEDTLLDNLTFAAKMLPPFLVADKRAYRQLKSEALVALKLVHPNIVQIRAFEENAGSPFLVMDYVDGVTLDDLIVERGSLTEDDVVGILRSIAAALDFAHSKGVVHRDVKPGNVMIAKDGTPYILDFGIAREIQETMTRVTGRLSSGTLLYMSPEQLMGEKPTPAQDIYSFAAMAYECLKGEPPFSRGQIEFQIMNKPPEPLAEVSATGSLPGGANGQAVRSTGIAASVMAGLAKKPEDRPKTCSAVLAGHVSSPLRGTSPVFGEKLGKAALKIGDTKTINLPGGVEMEMVYVAPGSFMMGSPESEEGHENDETQHRVTLTKGYWLGKYEVTQRQWKSVMGSNPSEFKCDDRPVETVSWEDCQEFIRKVNDAAIQQFGGKVRLPTEAEWEYACRAGTTGAYAGTGDLDSMGWYDDNSGGETHPVGTKKPNAWGLCDMHGNVWEWCQDWYGDYGGDITDPQGPASGDYRVLRGGSWAIDARYCRSASRSGSNPGYRNNGFGFRLCCSAGPRE